jgi:hypothetical protein
MKRILYQSRFCAECGISLSPRSWWQHRYLCAHCVPRLSQRKLFWTTLSAGTLLLLALRLTPRHSELTSASSNVHANQMTATAPVSAYDAAVTPLASLEPPVSPVTTFQCGARTKKGTPCKHRVAQAGQRCAQHQGRASILREK